MIRAEIHLIELIAGENNDEFDIVYGKVLDALPYRIGRTLEPVRIIRRLLGREDVHEAAAEHVEFIGLNDVLVQRCRVELGKDENPVDSANSDSC